MSTDEDETPLSDTEVDQRVLQAVRQAGGTLSHVARTSGVPRSQIWAALERLLAAGKIERRWVLIARGAHEWKYFAVEPQEF